MLTGQSAHPGLTWMESRLVEGSEEASAKLTSQGSRNFDLIGRMPRCPQADQPEGNSSGKKSWLEDCVSLSQDRTASSHSIVMTPRVHCHQVHVDKTKTRKAYGISGYFIDPLVHTIVSPNLVHKRSPKSVSFPLHLVPPSASFSKL